MEKSIIKQFFSDEKGLKREVWKIAVPGILEVLFTTFASIIDTKMVSVLGKEAISAISVTNQPRLFLLCFFFAINTSVSALVPRYIGKQDRRRSNEIFRAALNMAVIFGIIVSAAGILFARPIMQLCSGQKDTMDMSVQYFSIMMGGMIINVLYMLINSAMRGCGRTTITMTSNIISCCVNVFFNYCLIAGHLGFPALGVRGAAIATVLGFCAALIASVTAFMNRDIWVNLRYLFSEHIRATKEALNDVLGMWKHICTENLLLRVGFLFSSSITARIGSSDMALYSIGMTLMNISFAFGDGFQSAALALVGRTVGEGDLVKLRRYNHVLQTSGLTCSLIMGAVYCACGSLYYSWFISDPALIHTGAISCIIIGIICPIQVSQVIYNGVLKAMGKTKITMIVAVISVTVINTLALVVTVLWLHMGLWGVWLSALISQAVRLALLFILYLRDVHGSGSGPAEAKV